MKPTFVLLCICFAATGQTSSSDAQTLQALLAEVHQLRVALERSNQIGPRVQISLERLRMQQEQVTRVA